MEASNIRDITLLHMLPLMNPHFQHRMYSSMKKRGDIRSEELILPKLAYQFPQIEELIIWKEMIAIVFLTLFLMPITHAPWLQILIFLEIIYYLYSIICNYIAIQ